MEVLTSAKQNTIKKKTTPIKKKLVNISPEDKNRYYINVLE